MKRVDSIPISLLKDDPKATSRAARQDGGVRVVDAEDKLLFQLVIPGPLIDDEDHCPGCRCASRQRRKRPAKKVRSATRRKI